MSRGKQRTVWAIKHRLGVSLIRANNGPRAAMLAERLMGVGAGPYEIMRDQDQNIAVAKVQGAEVIDVAAAA